MMNVFRVLVVLLLSLSMSAWLSGCDREEGENHATTSSTDGHDHDHDDEADHDHGEDEPLGTAMIGDIEIEAVQGHGEAAAGKELHIEITLPYSDNGATEVRVWIGTEDRFASVVEKADYSSGSKQYSAHADAPDPLPENAAWWIEITQPDGTVHTGSIGLK
ncbi:MAG: hypothetical protein ACF8MJ_01875 [Phycisphaerales bacterium JB050]